MWIALGTGKKVAVCAQRMTGSGLVFVCVCALAQGVFLAVRKISCMKKKRIV